MLSIVSNGTLFVSPSSAFTLVNGRYEVSYANNGDSIIAVAESGCEYHGQKGQLVNGDFYVAAGPVHFLNGTTNHQLDGTVYGTGSIDGVPASLPPSLTSVKFDQGYYYVELGVVDDGIIKYRFFIANFNLADRYGGSTSYSLKSIMSSGDSVRLAIEKTSVLSTGRKTISEITRYFTKSSILRGRMVRVTSYEIMHYQWHDWPKDVYIPAGFFDNLLYSSYESIPRLQMNNLDNVLRIAELCRNPLATIWDVAKTALGDVKIKDVGKAWLSYRYEYNTTKADLEELQHSLNSVTEFQYGNSWYRCQAADEIEYRGLPYYYKVTYYARPNQSPAAKFKRLCNAYGVAPTATNLWDMVPLSFIIDWFTTMDDFVKIVDLQSELRAQAYILTEFCIGYECKFRQKSTGLEEKHFKRSVVSNFPFSYSTPTSYLAFDMGWIQDNTKSVLRRTADLAALFLS